ncbi:hypothetical protein BDQ17DRAFT_1408252 [Cyathus striatus]|nr:hypothetical protein BDQ17DRAFT_1408252 [Cyathus striatus]
MSSKPTVHNDAEHQIIPRAKFTKARLDKVGSQLDRREVFWRNHEPWLKADGYILRPRSHPNWIPSWFVDPSKTMYDCEDYRITIEGSLVDAIREVDGLQVMLKRVNLKNYPTELAFANIFSSELLTSNPKNHCVPVYEILDLPDDNDYAILVMPFLLKFDQPPFICIGEIVEFLRQLLEGLHFMHQQNIAHCDVKSDNVMADTLRLYRVPPHPLISSRNVWDNGKPKLASNRMQKMVKHYFVDFGLSSLHGPPGSPRLQYPGYGGTRSVPEFQNDSSELCDPFAVDIYCMGAFIHTRFREGETQVPAFRGLKFLDDLITEMI